MLKLFRVKQYGKLAAKITTTSQVVYITFVRGRPPCRHNGWTRGVTLGDGFRYCLGSTSSNRFVLRNRRRLCDLRSGWIFNADRWSNRRVRGGRIWDSRKTWRRRIVHVHSVGRDSPAGVRCDRVGDSGEIYTASGSRWFHEWHSGDYRQHPNQGLFRTEN